MTKERSSLLQTSTTAGKLHVQHSVTTGAPATAYDLFHEQTSLHESSSTNCNHGMSLIPCKLANMHCDANVTNEPDCVHSCQVYGYDNARNSQVCTSYWFRILEQIVSSVDCTSRPQTCAGYRKTCTIDLRSCTNLQGLQVMLMGTALFYTV